MTTITTTTPSGSCLMFPLFVVFLVLKLTGNIVWSWWIVTLPLWIGFVTVLAIGAAAAAGAGVFLGGAALLDKVGFGRYLINRSIRKHQQRLK